jgi:hypothetical protein
MRFESQDLSHARFDDVNLAGARFRECDLAGTKMSGVLLEGADIDGAIDGLIVNGVEVAPLIEAELDRRHPERLELRPTDGASARRAIAIVQQMWAPTMARAAALSEGDRRESVDGEWSFLQTLRHLLFVTDAWFRRSVLDLPEPFSPESLPASFVRDGSDVGIDGNADPSFDHLAQARAERFAQIERYLDDSEDAVLLAPGRPPTGPGLPPARARTPMEYLLVVFSEEWEHHRFAVRDLDRLPGNLGRGVRPADSPAAGRSSTGP